MSFHQETARVGARAAIAAIEQSKTHVVAPVNATGEMVGEWRQSQINGDSIEGGYFRMLAARPKQEDVE